MSISKQLLSGLLMAGCLAACGPMLVEPELTISASPRTIDGLAQKSIIKLVAVDDKAKPGTGKVRITSVAGSLKDGAEVDLLAGEGSTDFTCERATEPACTGTVRLTAEWVVSGKLATATTSITITPAVVDAGFDAGVVDAGFDAGIVDAGVDAGFLDAGLVDGGFFTSEIIEFVVADKQLLLEGTTDRMVLTFAVRANTPAMLPLQNATVTFTLTAGSFDGATQVSTITGTTDSFGRVNRQVFVGAAVAGQFFVTATTPGASLSVPVRVARVNMVSFKPDPLTRSTLTIRGVAQAFTSVVFFEVRDGNDMPMQGVNVDFSLASSSASGCGLNPTSDVTNAQGVVRTTVTSGSSQGSVTVLAQVLGRMPSSSPAFAIVIGRPSDEKLTVSCDRKTLGTLQFSTPPRTDTTTPCQATFADRNSVKPPFDIAVSWFAEAGSMNGAVSLAGSGFAVTTYNTGAGLPVTTTPLAGEPFVGSNNPRDNIVTIVASLPGEEYYVDGSGSSAGTTNGRWDPGEWFVDIGEPYIDRNDNGRFDVGEPHLDVEQYDCATGLLKPGNTSYDGPNGCWDQNTQIWRPTHIAYSNALVTNPVSPFIEFSPALPSFIAVGATRVINFDWFDPFFNRLDPEQATIGVTTISGTRGSISVTPRLNDSEIGHGIDYVTVQATESAAGSNVFVENGPCDYTGVDAGYPLTRCLRTYKFTGWKTKPSGGQLTILGPTAQPLLTDGGVPPPTTSVYEMRVSNRYQSGPSVYQFQISYE